jgi:hypothetical protein
VDSELVVHETKFDEELSLIWEAGDYRASSQHFH